MEGWMCEPRAGTTIRMASTRTGTSRQARLPSLCVTTDKSHTTLRRIALFPTVTCFQPSPPEASLRPGPIWSALTSRSGPRSGYGSAPPVSLVGSPGAVSRATYRSSRRPSPSAVNCREPSDSGVAAESASMNRGMQRIPRAGLKLATCTSGVPAIWTATPIGLATPLNWLIRQIRPDEEDDASGKSV